VYTLLYEVSCTRVVDAGGLPLVYSTKGTYKSVRKCTERWSDPCHPYHPKSKSEYEDWRNFCQIALCFLLFLYTSTCSIECRMSCSTDYSHALTHVTLLYFNAAYSGRRCNSNLVTKYHSLSLSPGRFQILQCASPVYAKVLYIVHRMTKLWQQTLTCLVGKYTCNTSRTRANTSRVYVLTC
jgi:hypothetical protein